MAGFVVQPNTLKVLVHSQIETRAQLNVLHMLYTPAGPLNPNIAETIWATARAQLVAAAVPTVWATVFQVNGVGVIDLRAPSNPEITSTSAALVGTGTENPLPSQNSIVVTERTAFTGRSHRGRIYTYGYTVGAVDANGAITAGASGGALVFAQAFQAGIAAAGGQLAINSPAMPDRPAHDGSTLPAKPHEITPVTTVVVRDAIWDTNRRRLDTLRR